jgi:hypothetical protein
MNMIQKTIDAMNDREFESILDQIGENDSDMTRLPDFLETLWTLSTKKATNVIELKAKLVNDHIEIEAPEGVAAHGNEVILGNHHIILNWSTT